MQCVYFRLAAAKRNMGGHDVTAAADFEYLAAKADRSMQTG